MISLVRHTDDTPLYFIAQVEDISKLKYVEQVNQQLMERITPASEAGGTDIWEWELKPNVFSRGKRVFELYGTPPHIKLNWQVWYECALSEDRQHAEKVIHDSLQSRSLFKLEFHVTVKDGIRHIRALANRVLNKEDEVEHLLGINIGMTEIKQLNEALFQEKECLHITLDSIGGTVVCINIATKITLMNPVAEKISGWTQEEALGVPPLAVLYITFGNNDPLMENIYSVNTSYSVIERDMALYRRSGDSYGVHHSITPSGTLDGSNIGSVLVIQDVIESRKMLRQLSYSAPHSALMHLANRASFEKQLHMLLRTVNSTHQRHALMLIDLDRFKTVNDSAGHVAGDVLLRELASLMLSTLCSGDMPARLGGDEFGLPLPDCNIGSARFITTRTISAVNGYHFIWESRVHRVDTGAGVALIDDNNHQAAEVMSRVDITYYISKNGERGRVMVCEPQQVATHSERATMSLDEQ